MACRPNSIEQRVKKLENGLFKYQENQRKNKNDIKEIKKEINGIKEREVISLLSERKANGRYMNSYKEIADYVGMSVGKVSNIASANNLSRLNSVK